LLAVVVRRDEFPDPALDEDDFDDDDFDAEDFRATVFVVVFFAGAFFAGVAGRAPQASDRKPAHIT